MQSEADKRTFQKNGNRTTKNGLATCIKTMILPRYSMFRLRLIFFLLTFTITSYGRILPKDGHLTVHNDLQKLATKLLEGKQGSIVAIEPATGEVLCMVSSSHDNDDVNHAIETNYSPGSTFKVANTLAFVSEGIINHDSKYICQEGFWREKIHIGCHKHSSPRALTGALSTSCNAYFCKAFMAMIENRSRYKGQSQALNTWYDYMVSMGLGAPLGIDLPNEQGGFVPDAAYCQRAFNKRWNAQTIMWLGMGQGEVQTTSLQLCNLAAIIANRGFFYTPHVHKGTDKKPLDRRFTVRRDIKCTPKAMNEVVAGMRAAVTGGTCASINTPNYQICGKTGTAENAGDDHSVFIGFAPMNSPEIAISVYIDNGGFGADLAAPIAAIILEKYLMGTLSERSESHVEQWQNYTIEPPTPVDSTLTKVSTVKASAGKKGREVSQKKRKEIPVTLDNL